MQAKCGSNCPVAVCILIFILFFPLYSTLVNGSCVYLCSINKLKLKLKQILKIFFTVWTISTLQDIFMLIGLLIYWAN